MSPVIRLMLLIAHVRARNRENEDDRYKENGIGTDTFDGSTGTVGGKYSATDSPSSFRLPRVGAACPRVHDLSRCRIFSTYRRDRRFRVTFLPLAPRPERRLFRRRGRKFVPIAYAVRGKSGRRRWGRGGMVDRWTAGRSGWTLTGKTPRAVVVAGHQTHVAHRAFASPQQGERRRQVQRKRHRQRHI